MSNLSVKTNSTLETGSITSLSSVSQEYYFANLSEIVVPKQDGQLAFNAWSAQTVFPHNSSYQAGTSAAAISICGKNAAGSHTNLVFSFNGNSFTSMTNYPLTIIAAIAVGSPSATLVASGSDVGGTVFVNAYKFDGVTWASTGNCVFGHYRGTSFGNASSMVGVTGAIVGGALSNSCDSFNGSTWSAIASINGAAKNDLGSSGVQNAGLITGGHTGVVQDTCEKYNGNTWSIIGPNLRIMWGASVHGTQNASLVSSGNDGSYTTACEKYNGILFSSTTPCSVGTIEHAGAGVANSALKMAGRVLAGRTNAVEKFHGELKYTPLISVFSDDEIKFETTSSSVVVPGGSNVNIENIPIPYLSDQEQLDLEELRLDVYDGVWSTSGNLSVARSNHGGAGTQNAAVAFGGWTGSASTTVVEKFNGTTWSTAANILPHVRNNRGMGTQNAAISPGGSFGSGSVTTQATCTAFDGTVWSAAPSLIAARNSHACYGVRNSGIVLAGKISGVITNACEKFNGTAWSATGNTSTVLDYHAAFGVGNAGTRAGGDNGSFITVTCEKHNGSVWSATGSLNVATSASVGAGTQNNGRSTGGLNTSTTSTPDEVFNGTLWKISASASTPIIYGTVATGTQASATRIAGHSTVDVAVTEKYNQILPTHVTEFARILVK